MHSFLKKLFAPSRAARRRDARLSVTRLEDRAVPIVGAFDLPAAVAGGYDGVVRVMDPTGGNCSGTLLWTGRHVLTAAHCVDDDIDLDGDGNGDVGDGQVDAGKFAVTFDMSKTITFAGITKDKITLAPGWNGAWSSGNDLAIIELPALAPHGAERFHPFRGTDEEGRWYFAVGYGRTGTADNPGTNPEGVWSGDNMAGGVKRIGANFFDDVIGPNDSRLASDLDEDSDDWASGGPDVSTAPGDSGGPFFLWGPTGLEIAGVTSGGDQAILFGADEQITRVSSFKDWIDTAVGKGQPYDLVVDMNFQPWGNDQMVNLLEVNAVGAADVEVALDGYRIWSDAAANVKSITLIGSDDDEQFTVRAGDRPLPVTVDGLTGKGVLEVIGSPATDWVNIYNDSVLLTPNPLSGGKTAAIAYDNLTLVRVKTLGGADAVTVDEAAPLTPVIVSAGEQNDTVTLTAPRLLGADVTVHGEGGADTLTVRHSNDPFTWFDETWSSAVYADRVEFPDPFAAAPRRCDFDGTETVKLIGESGDDEFAVHGVPVGTRVTIDGNGGNDRLYGEAANTNWAITGVNAGNAGGPTRVVFEEVEIVYAGAKADRFEFAPGAALTGGLDGGAGTDTVVGANQANGFTVTGAAAGSFDGGKFAAVEALAGGAGDDRFALHAGVVFAGTVSGGGGEDTLDYAAYHTYGLTPFSPFPQAIPINVTVNLGTGAATGVTGGATQIDHVAGGLGNDTLTGTGTPNLLRGGAGKDTLDGGGGRDLLIGGTGADTLTGGAGDDLLIAGSVSFESNPTAVLAVLGYWLSPTTYLTRIADLRAGFVVGSSTYRLDAASVTNDPDVDRLTGGTDRDWFWGVSVFMATNQVPADTFTDRVTAIPFPNQPDTRETLN